MIFNRRTLLLLAFCIINISWIVALFIISVLNGAAGRFFLFLTLENFMFCTAYLVVVTFHEILEKHDSKLYLFFVRRVGKFVFTSCWTVVFSYWIFTFMGGDVMIWINEWYFIIMTLYLHLAIGFIMIFEHLSCSTRHYVKGVFYHDLLILTCIMICYMIVLVFVSKTFEIYIYEFLRKDLLSTMGYNITSIMNYVVSYLLYYALARRNNIGIIDDSLEEDILESKTKIEQNNDDKEKNLLSEKMDYTMKTASALDQSQ